MSKPLDRITLLQTFVRIADAGSISAAARDLGLSQPSASRQLAELESRLRTQLMHRNTHSLALTAAGKDLLLDARQLIDGWESLEEKHRAGERRAQGPLNIVAPVALGQLHLARLAAKFQQRHPQVTVRWQLQDEPIRFAETGCDCWIRVGAIPDDSLIVKRLAIVERLLVGSRSFVKRHGKPASPDEAARLDLLGLDPFEAGKIPLQHRRKGGPVLLQPNMRMTTNNIMALKEATLMGLGMAVLPKWFVASELKRGRLLNMLPGWQPPSLPIHLAYLPGRHRPKRLRAFLDMLHADVPAIDGVTAAR